MGKILGRYGDANWQWSEITPEVRCVCWCEWWFHSYGSYAMSVCLDRTRQIHTNSMVKTSLGKSKKWKTDKSMVWDLRVCPKNCETPKFKQIQRGFEHFKPPLPPIFRRIWSLTFLPNVTTLWHPGGFRCMDAFRTWWENPSCATFWFRNRRGKQCTT